MPRLALSDRELLRTRFVHRTSARVELVGAVRCAQRTDSTVRFNEFRASARRYAELLSAFGRFDDQSHRALARRRRIFDLLVRPYWRQIQQHVERERRRYLDLLSTQGLDGVLAAMCPRSIHWDRPMLTIESISDGRAAPDPHGHDLRIVPSFFHYDVPAIWISADSRIVIAYPVPQDLGRVLRPDAPVDSHRLENLIGRTRAELVSVVGDRPGVTTSEIAILLRISPASASEQTTVLARAGVVTKTRRGNTVGHHLTSFGRTLLIGNA